MGHGHIHTCLSVTFDLKIKQMNAINKYFKRTLIIILSLKCSSNL